MHRRVALAFAGLALAGCSQSVSGVARPASRAVTLLPTESQVSAAVGNQLNTFGFHPFVGGQEIMPDGFRDDADATPIRCVGVTDTMTRVTYDGADLIEAARQSYFSLSAGVDVTGADAAVVRFGSAGAARDRFQTFVTAWQNCNGNSVVKHLRGTSGADVDAHIDGVDVDGGGVLTATLTTRQGTGPAAHYARAVGLRDTTVVEVSLAVTAAAEGGASARAVALAQAMLDKVAGG
jgi:PknH-like protein